MRAARWRSRGLIVLLLVCLPTIALVQYRWLGQLSQLEQLQARTTLTTSARRFSTEFDVHLAQVYSRFHAPALAAADTAHLTDALRPLMRRVSPPGLIEQVFVVERRADGVLETRVVSAAQPPVSVPAATPGWPAWLDRAARQEDDDLVTLPAGLQRNLLDEVPAIVIPQPHAGRERWLVVALDRRVIVESWLPSLLEGCFEGGESVQYDVLITREDAPDHVIFASTPGLSQAGFADWVSRMPLFALHSRDLDGDSAASLLADAAGHRWRLFVRPQAGAVEAALGAARTRNLAMSLGSLAVLGTSALLLVVSVHRTQRAAQEQLEVVARISHELRTPLATIRCAGENLADNLIASEEDTRQYGQMIHEEATRLTRTVQDILLSCRLQARPDEVLHFRPLALPPVLHLAVADARLLVGAHAAQVQTQVEADLPAVLADRDALSMVFKNLVQNALTHGAGRPVTVTARTRRSAAGREVVVEVRDAGPGIPAGELTRLFEPFFRGQAARDQGIHGTGIGLSLVRQAVESHGGRITVSSSPTRGTAFSVSLPAVRTTALES